MIPLPYETPINLADSNRWTLRFSASYSTVSPPSSAYFEPISEQIINHQFNSPIIAIQGTSVTVPSAKYIGRISQYLPIGITAGSGYMTSRRVWIGTQVEIFRQDLEPPYTLRFKPNPKLNSVSILIWEYIP